MRQSLTVMLVLAAGDEYAQTRGGNNNWYGHDTKLTRFDWNALEAVRNTFFRFYRCACTLADIQAFLIFCAFALQARLRSSPQLQSLCLGVPELPLLVPYISISIL